MTPPSSESTRSEPGSQPDTRPHPSRLCDTRGRRILVPIRASLLAFLVVFGLIAVAVSGFLGYPPTITPSVSWEGPFHLPWLLFMWLCALAWVMILLVFRDVERAGQRLFVSAVLLVGAVGESIIYYIFFYRRLTLADVLRDLGNFGSAVANYLARLQILQYLPFYAVANYAVLVVLVGDMLYRWLYLFPKSEPEQTKAGATPSAEAPDLRAARVRRARRVHRGLAGDFVVRGLVVLFMAVLVIFVAPMMTGANCNVGVLGECASVPALGLLDMAIGLLALIVGFPLLGLVGFMDTLADPQTLPADPADSTASAGMGWIRMGEEAVARILVPLANVIRESAIWLITKIQVNILPAARALLWMLLLLIGIAGAGSLAIAVQDYFHTHPRVAADPHVPLWQGWLQASIQTLLPSIGPYAVILASGVVFALAVTAALAVLADSRGTMLDELNFLRLVLFRFLIYFCLLSFVLLALQLYLWISNGCFPSATGAYCTSPRSGPFGFGLLTCISFVLMVFFSISWLLRGRRQRTRDLVTANTTQREHDN